MAEPHNNLMEKLSLDIITEEILPRLPAKSVGRSKCVCKQWLSFLSTQEFASAQCRHNIKENPNPKLLIIDRPSHSILTIDCESPNHGLTTINTAIPFKARPSDVLILASLDGLVCICLRKTCELVIWNPVTRVYKKLSNSKSQGLYKKSLDVVGFYIDSSKDYKILHIKRRRGTMGVYIYSRRLDSWRKINFIKKRNHIYSYVWSSITFSGESLYLIVEEWCIGGEILIIRFDVNSEKFKEIRFPDIPRGASRHGNLVNIENRIHLFVSYWVERDMCVPGELDLWRMEGDEWVKVAAFPRTQYIPLSWTPIYVMRNGKWLVLCEWNGDVYEKDMKTHDNMFVYPGGWLNTLQRVVYIETIVSPSL